MTEISHLSTDELNKGMDNIRAASAERGTLEMIVRRPAVDEREVLDEAELDLGEGVVGDNWNQRPSSRTDDGSPHPDMQLNIMNARAIGLIAGSRDRWSLAGDQLYLDFDISETNLPAGTRLSIGEAVIEVTDQPHRGCPKFKARFGIDALRWVNSSEGMELKLRGINAKVVSPGAIKHGDTVSKL